MPNPAIDYNALAAQSRGPIDYNALAAQSRTGEAAPRSTFAGFLDSVKEYAGGLNPTDLVTGLGDTVRSLYTDKSGNVSASAPGRLATNVAERNLQSLHEAQDAWHKGNYSAAALHAFNYVAPFGSALDDMLNDAEQGHVARSLGKATKLGVSSALAPKLLGAAGAIADEAPAVFSRLADGVKAAAPDVAAGTGKLAAGAVAAKILPHEAQIALGYPIFQGGQQVGRGLAKGYQAMRGAAAEDIPPVAVTPTPTPALAADPPLISPAPPGYASRPDAIPSEHGILPPLDRSQFFRPLGTADASAAVPAPEVAPQVAPPVEPPPAVAPATPEAALLAKSRAAFDAQKTAAIAPPEAQTPPDVAPSVATEAAPAGPTLTAAQRFEDAQHEHAARLQMQADDIVWGNRARKADRFVNYLTENKLEPTPENLASASRALAEREAPSGDTVDMIHDRMNYTAPEVATPEVPGLEASPAPSVQTRPAPVAADGPPKPGSIAQISPHSISVDPVRFQFKRDTGGAAGVSDKLKGLDAYDSDLGGTISVWHDPADGKTYVVNGHHRLELAQRTNARSVDVRYIDAPNAMQARAKGALINIAEDQGTALDAAKLFRDTGITPAALKARNISLDGKVARAGLGLSNLSQEIFDQVAAGDIPPEKASVIGEMLPGKFADQRAVIEAMDKAAARGKAMTPAQIAESIRVGMRPGAEITETQDTLFGSVSETRSLFGEIGELSDYVRQQLAQEKRTFGAVASDSAAERLGKAGNVINKGENLRIAAETKQAQAVYDKLSGMSGPVSDALASGARDLAANTGNSNAIKQATYNAVRKAISETVPGGDGGVSSRLRAEPPGGSGQAAEQRNVDLGGPPNPEQIKLGSTLKKLRKSK